MNAGQLGSRPPRTARRRILGGIAAFALIGGLAACGGDDDSGTDETAEESTAADGTAAAGDATATTAATAGASATTAAAAAAGDDAASGDGEITGELTWATITPPSISPFKALAGNAPFLGIAYDPLWYIDGEGEITPALATEWVWVGEGNTVLDVTLRDGVTFSDGAVLTAEAAKQHFDQFKEGTTSRFRLAALQSVEVTGPLSLRFTLSTPNPDFLRTLADVDTPGHLISPTALAAPDSLEGVTAGAGPYMLDPDDTVAGDHYTFVPNPNYWNTSRDRFETIVVRNVTDPAAALSAVQTGQADIASGTLATAAAAKGAGLDVKTAPQMWVGIGLLDRGGTLVPALGDQRVRQALNYAIDREAIVEGIYGEYGTPTDGIATPGFLGFTEPTVKTYAYDPERAKQLMAEAGFADGFSMALLQSTNTDPNNNMVNAIADYWGELGVSLEITNDPVNWGTQFGSKTFPAAIDLNGNGLIAQANSQLLPLGTSFNPFGSSDDQINSLYAEAVAAPEDERDGLLAQMADRARELAWFVPVVLQQSIVLAGPDAPDFDIGPLNTYAQVGELEPRS